MRALLYCLPLLPVPAFADTFTVPSSATAAMVYRSSALVTHDVALTLPAGTHEIVFPDLPPDLYAEYLRVTAPDLKLGAIRYRSDLTPPRATQDSPEIMAAKSRVDAIETEMEAIRDTAARQRLAVEAAEAQIAFLRGLGASDTLPNDPAALSALSAMIGRDTLAAREDAFTAERAVRDTLRALEDLEDDLAQANQALAALVPEAKDRPLLVLDVTVPKAVSDAALSITFPVEAFWMPTYDLRLSLDPAPQVVIDRGAQVIQASGENWENVALTLSTQEISGALTASELYPHLRRIFDQKELYGVQLRSTASADMAPQPVMETPVVVQEASSMRSFPQGLSMSYAWSDPVNVASGADAVRLPFDTVTLDAEVVARAVPLLQGTAFLMARVTNTTGAPLLESEEALRFVNGGLVGGGRLMTIEAGQDAEIGFGSIDGLQITRRVLKRGEADRGIISRSNELTEEVRISLENLTSRTWDVELRDRVPYSEQEDLVITYRASPTPDVEAVDDKRGVLQWNVEMAPGNEATVSVSHKITWPEGQTLR